MSGSRVGNELSDIDLRVLCLVAINSIFHLATEGTDESLDWPSCRVTQGTDSVTFDLERKFLKHIDFSEIRITFLYTS
jgi:predicted nucleotidyltransferase